MLGCDGVPLQEPEQKLPSQADPKPGWGIGLVVMAGVLQAAFANNVNREFLPVLLCIALAVAFLAVVANRKGAPSSALMASLAASALVGLCVIWNWGQQVEIASGTSSDIFRSSLRWPHVPVYGTAQVFRSITILPAMFVLAGVVVCVFHYRHKIGITGITVLAFLIALSYSLCVEPAPGSFAGNMAELASGANQFDSLAHLMASHNELQPTLEFRPAHYPAGVLLPFVAARDIGLPWFTRLFFLGASVATLPVLFHLAKELGCDSRRACWLLASSPAFCIASALWIDGAVMLFCALSTLCALIAARRSLLLFSAASGLSLLMAMFLSFTTLFFVPMLVFLGIALTFRGEIKGQRLLAIAVVALAAGILGLLALRLTGYDLVRSLLCSRELTYRGGWAGGYDSSFRVLLRATGAILAFFFMAGASLAALVCRRSPIVRAQCLRGSLWAALLLGGFSGMVFLETERVWAYFLPMLALAASATHTESDQRQHENSLPIFVLAQIVMLALLLPFFDFRNG